MSYKLYGGEFGHITPEQRQTLMVPCRRCGEPFNPAPFKIKHNQIVCNPCLAAYLRKWREGNEGFRERMRKTAARRVSDPSERPRWRARWAVRAALRSGKLVRQGCEVCGETKTHAHHDDYSKPLEVRWLCVAHHHDHHNKDRKVSDVP